MFLSPIFYPTDILSEKWRVAFALNPLTGILQGFRASMFGGSFDWLAIGISVVLTFALAVFSFFVFKRMEDDFADLI
jgi:lipopolysaccharide transport system permease protein